MSMHLNRASIARSITTALGASRDLNSLASGLIQPKDYLPETEGQYSQFRRYLHDLFCLSLIDSGHFKSQSFQIEKIGLTSTDIRLTKQTPDLYKLESEALVIGEVTATYTPELDKKLKYEKYESLMQFLEKSGQKATLEVIVVDLTNPEWELEFPNISQLYMEVIQTFLDTLKIIHSLPKFSEIRSKMHKKYNVDRFQYKLEDSTLVNEVFKATGVRMEPSKLKSMLDDPSQNSCTEQSYIDGICNAILSREPKQRPAPEQRSIDPVTMRSEFETLFSAPPTTSKLPKILQLGCPSMIDEFPQTFEEAVSSFRSSGRSGGYLTFIMNSLNLESPDENRIIKLHLNQAQKDLENLEGPGRKAYLKKHGIEMKREAPSHIGVLLSHESELLTFIDVLNTNITSMNLREIQIPSSSVTGLGLQIELNKVVNKLSNSKISALLVFYQLISNEIVLNSMRRRKTNEYSFGYSGVRGVYFIVAPGPQLRTENNVEFVKIISLVPPVNFSLTKTWNQIGDHWESSWISVDVDRLKHWQRSFDRVSLTLMANAERLVRPHLTFQEAFTQEIQFNNYALLALTFLENKQLTSVTNQTLRYLWMKSIGDKQFKGLASKFPTRVNSVIQSMMLRRSVETCEQICKMPLNELIHITKLNRDDSTGFYDETTTGVVSLMPRIFTYGTEVPISYNLNEIYFCMMYNKDRQNAAQDSLKILSKIVKEEDKYDKEINNRESDLDKVRYFLGQTTLEEDIKHITTDNPESHYYSSRAVLLGLKSQDNHDENLGDRGSWMNSDKLEKILSKPLSEYATFKASVESICHLVNHNDLRDIKKLGVRTKAIELISKIIEDENLLTASELAMKFSGCGNESFKVFIQIFKKGQIGGVREIIILWIKARVMMNIVEEIARLLCKSDKREILTKGRDKRLMMRGDFEEVTSKFPKGTPIQVIKESFDMTAWCQKFIPMIFAHTCNYHFRDYPGIRDLSRHIFLAHSNKEIEFPRKLVEVWCKHKEFKHSEPHMEKLKTEFLKSGKPYLVNHSNMCQGIPHYNSSVLGLSSISFRDVLFNRCLEILKIKQSIYWKTRLGSDDKGTLIALDLTDPTSKFQSSLLGQCEQASERLHCMELSIKSASGNVMYELNSAFMANLETLSPTIKFSLAATDTVETTSCSTFVNESFARIRQLRENGGSSLLCQMAHSLNSRHFYNIFDTGPSGVNCVNSIFNQAVNSIPYDFGVYPQFDSDLHEIIGPEFYNYRIFKTVDEDKSAPLKLLYTELSRRESDELFKAEDDPLLKKDHFGIQQGLVRQLQGMRERTNSKAQEVEEFFVNNPFIIVRGPETWKEALMLVKSKLFTKGAAQALRRTSPAIYIGRLSAFRSAEAWFFNQKQTVGYDIETQTDIEIDLLSKHTYRDYLKLGIEHSKKMELNELRKMKEILFPQFKSFDVVEQICGKFGYFESSTKKYSQAIRTWTVNNYNYEFNSSLKSILQTAFKDTQDASIEEVNEFKKLLGLNLESLEKFKIECKERNLRPLDMFFYMTKLHKSSKTSKIQAFAHGPSTSSLHMTMSSIKRFGHMVGMTSTLEEGYIQGTVEWSNTMASKIEKIKLLHNMIVMRETNRFSQISEQGLSSRVGELDFIEECKTIVRSVKSLSGFDNMTQKSIKMVACFYLEQKELREKLIEWKDTNFTFIQRQRRIMGKNSTYTWQGNLEVLVSSGNECYTLNEQNGRRFINCKKIIDHHTFYRSLVHMCRTLGIEMQTFFERRNMRIGDIYLSESSKSVHESQINRESANVLKVRFDNKFKFKRIVDLQQFKINKSTNKKENSFEIYLSDNEGRTSTVCHSAGNYYPVEVVDDFHVNEGLFFEGVRLNSILKNRLWFFNFRLPSMTQVDVMRFLKNDVNFEVVLKLDNSDRLRIREYVEVREEVNEEAFSLTRDSLMEEFVIADEFDTSGLTYNEMFRKAMDIQVKNASNASMFVGVSDWAQEVTDTFASESSKLIASLEGEDGLNPITVIKSLGYKKPARRTQAYTISSLQQGGVLKDSILNCFFRSMNIQFETLKDLPYMCIWLDGQHRTNPENQSLIANLKTLILKYLTEVTGTHPRKVLEAIEGLRNKLEIPIKMLSDFMLDVNPEENDALQMILKSREDYQSDISDDEDFDYV